MDDLEPMSFLGRLKCLMRTLVILVLNRKPAMLRVFASNTMGIVILKLDRTDRAGHGVSVPALRTLRRANLQGRTNRVRFVKIIAKSSLVADMLNL